MRPERLAVIGPRPLRGRLRVPGDKSISHRALLCALLASGTSEVTGLSGGEDVARTRAAIVALGAEVDGDRITGGKVREPAAVVDVGNSGTSIRLLAGVAASQSFLTVLQGDTSIARRPMDRVAEPLRRMGAHVDGRDGGRLPPLAIRGGDLVGIDYALPVASAQVKSAILYAALSARGETVVRQPAPTRTHTEDLLAACGADVRTDGLAVHLRPSRLEPFRLAVPGDPSQAAFWLVGACLVPGSDVTVEDVYVGPARAGFLDVLERMGADIAWEPCGRHRATLRARASGLRGVRVAAEEVPGLVDEVPVLAVAAAAAEGESRFEGLAELRVKESDRLATVAELLAAFGATTTVEGDALVVAGGGLGSGAAVDSHADHRIAMAGAIAGLVASGPTTVSGWAAVATSYPGFERDLEQLT